MALLDPQSSRGKILDVAEALFARRGYAGVGLREVAEAVGLGKSSLFHHFPSKSRLYFEVLRNVLERILERVQPVLDSSAPPLEKLDRGIDALVDALAEHPSTARLLLRGLVEDEAFGEPPPPEAQACQRLVLETVRGFERLMHEGVEAGCFRPVSAPHMVQTLIGATVYHFASGELGESVLGRPLLSAEAVSQRKQELRRLVHHGLATEAPASDRREPSWRS